MPQCIACRHPKLFILDFSNTQGVESHLTFLTLLCIYCQTIYAAMVSCCIENDSEVVKASFVEHRGDEYLHDDSGDHPEIAFPRQKMLSTWHKHRNNSCLRNSPNGQTCNATQSKLDIQSTTKGFCTVLCRS